METTVVSESPAATPGCICPGLGPGALYTHTRTHARTHARPGRAQDRAVTATHTLLQRQDG